MLGALSQRLLPVLQLTRMALVFTAISNAQCTLLLRSRQLAGPEGSILPHLHPWHILALALVSTGLYGFGMALNDIIDRRRDRQLASDRPLPSGRIGLPAAGGICIFLVALALVGGIAYAAASAATLLSLGLVLWTGALIVFYDLAGKYLVAPGLLALGLIRFFHASIPAPHLPLPWHPLLLLNHVTLLSAVCYAWEQKRPALTRLHWWAVLGGLAAIDAAAVVVVLWKAQDGSTAPMGLDRSILVPLGAAAVFVLIVIVLRLRSASAREAGQRAMLWGLLWLIVYDALFVATYVGWRAGAALLLLLPAAYGSVKLLRTWSRLLLAGPPQYMRAR